MANTYNGILFILNKKGTPVTCYNVHERSRHYCKLKKPVSHKKTSMYDPTYMRYLKYQIHRNRKQNGGYQVFLWGGAGRREVLFNGYAAAAKSLQSCPTLCDPTDRQPARLPPPWDSPGKNTGVGCHFLLQCMKVKSERGVTQSCPTLHNPIDCSLEFQNCTMKKVWRLVSQ